MNNYEAIPPTLKSGDEKLRAADSVLNHSLLDFWRWSVSDILSNATRGRFAEFIVATACGIDITVPRDEWGAFDLVTPSGIKIEVKSAAFIQSWFQNNLSSIQFSIKKTRGWDSSTNTQSNIKKRQADIYVFCLLSHKEQSTIDPLDMSQWEFYVVSVAQLDNYTRSEHSIMLNSLKRLANPVTYYDIAEEVRKKNDLNYQLKEGLQI